MRFTYTPEALRETKPYDDAEYQFLVLRARACILWHMAPEYFDSMPMKEHAAWLEAWNDINREDNN